MLSPPARRRLAAFPAAFLLLLGAGVGCARDPARRAGSAGDAWEAPRRRAIGPRSIPFAGGDPVAKGWVQADGLLWVEKEHAEAFSRGLVRAGGRYATVAEADALPKTPTEGYALRTDHLLVRTNVPFARARELARLAESHVGAVLLAFGEALDLRLPADPLRIVIAARREEYRTLLRERVSAEVSWNAFYEADDGTVYACDEPVAEGGLPVAADLRHEMVHALLDLGRSDAGRSLLFARPQFWAWEAAAVWAEGLGDPPGASAGAERLARFARRRAAGEVTPLAALFALRQDAFEGRHYDETASFVGWLMEAEGGRWRGGFLALVSEVMAGRGEAGSFERLVGLTARDAERRWLAAAPARGR